MRFSPKKFGEYAEADWTPMIDITFLLIAFFMVLINFTDAEQSERIKLPTSELAKPPEGPLEHPITLQLTEEGTIFYGGRELALADLRVELSIEAELLRRREHVVADATVIIRADGSSLTGRAQELMKMCQDFGFQKFRLRVKQEREEEQRRPS